MRKNILLYLKIKKNYCFESKRFCKWNSSDDLKFSYLLPVSFKSLLKMKCIYIQLILHKKGWKYTEKSRHPKTYRTICNYFYCMKHLQRVAFGTMKFNRLIELLGFISSQLCSNAILLRSRAVQNGFQFCVIQILMIC